MKNKKRIRRCKKMSGISKFEYDLTNKQKEKYHTILGERLIIENNKFFIKRLTKRIGLFFKEKEFLKELKDN
jgi:hypothetical protein